nr:hypothetical protein [Tanacetum cinerariifolium]
MQSSATQEYPSLIQTFYDTHTVGGVFLRDEDRHLYVRGDGEAIGSRHYTDDQNMAMVKNHNDETYDVEAIRSRRPANIFVEDWDAQIRFWSDPKNMAWCAQNARNRAKSIVAAYSCGTRIDIYIGDGEAIGSRHYTDDQIMAMVRRDKQHGHSSGVDRVLARRGKDVLDVLVPRCSHTSDVNELKRSNKHL